MTDKETYETYEIEMQLVRSSDGAIIRRELLLDATGRERALSNWAEFEAAAAMVWEKALFD